MSDDRQFKKLQEGLQPEVDRMRADHDRFMRLVARLPEPSEAQERAIAEASSPEGWQKAIAEAIADRRPQPGHAKYWLLAGAVVAVAVGVGLAIFNMM
jgi:hypothetical protein